MFREPAKRQASDSQVRDFFNLVAALSKQNKPQMVYDLTAIDSRFNTLDVNTP